MLRAAASILQRPLASHTLQSSQTRFLHASSALLNRRILISDPIQKPCIDILKQAGYEVTCTETVPKEDELCELIQGYDGLIVRSGTKVTSKVINAANKLSLIGRAGAGVDNIDVDAATKRGTMVMNTPGGNSASAAELTVSLIMAMSRQIPEASKSLKEGRWDRKKFMGTELNGKTIGIVGLGAIGRRVAKACQALDMTVLGYDPLLSRTLAEQSGIVPVKLEELFAQSDLISLHTPLNSDTRHLLNKETFAKCKQGVRIVNCARGGIVDEDDLLEALNSGRVAAAALDVYESEPPKESSKALLSHPNLICTPHLGANTDEAQSKVAVDIAHQFVDAFEGRQVVGVVNSRILSELAARKELHSYIELAERIGSLQAQLIQGRLQRVELRTRGHELKDGSSLLKAAALKGILSQLVEESVNYINAPLLASEFGLEVVEVHENRPSVHGSSLTITFETENGERKLVGTVLQGNKPRIVQVDNFNLELAPEGELLFFKNQDKPGFLSAVTGILGKNDINISTLALGRQEDGLAVGCLGLDSRLNAEITDELKAMDGLQWMHPASLPLLGDHGTILQGMKVDETMPVLRPHDPNFSSGPCKKRPGYDLAKISTKTLGRSHRSKLGLNSLQQVIQKSRTILGVPDDYLVGIVPASDTGAFEMAMWSMLGERPVDVCHWESFGKGWMGDIKNELKLENVREFKADYGELPDLSQTNSDHDVVFTWNGTTSGVKVPNGDWIAADRKGLTFCDATSAVFSMPMPWDKLDVVTYSWQKALGGEGAHGMLILSPRAVERLNSYKPNRPLPKIFRLTKGGKLNMDVFTGKVINTPSMLAAEDCLDALNWLESEGGLPNAISRSEHNLKALTQFVNSKPWIHFLAKDAAVRSNTSVCLTLDLPAEKVKEMTALLEQEGVAYDIGAYRDAPAGLRIWCGTTVQTADVRILCDWIEWAYQKVNHKA